MLKQTPRKFLFLVCLVTFMVMLVPGSVYASLETRMVLDAPLYGEFVVGEPITGMNFFVINNTGVENFCVGIGMSGGASFPPGVNFYLAGQHSERVPLRTYPQ